MRFTQRTGKAAHHARDARGTLPHSSPHDASGGTMSYDLELPAAIAREVAIEAKERRMHARDLIALIITDAVIEDAEEES